MKTQFHSGRAERAGTWLGRTWVKLLRREKQFVAWLVTEGVPHPTANVIVWIIKLAALGAALYLFLIAGAIVLVMLLAAYLLSQVELPANQKSKSEWRNGVHGFGLYDEIGHRIDPYDPNDVR